MQIELHVYCFTGSTHLKIYCTRYCFLGVVQLFYPWSFYFDVFLTLVYNRLLTLFLVLNLTFSFTVFTFIISVFQTYNVCFQTFYFLEEPSENHHQVIGGLLVKYQFIFIIIIIIIEYRELQYRTIIIGVGISPLLKTGTTLVSFTVFPVKP